jgi:general secretion pathway protein L
MHKRVIGVDLEGAEVRVAIVELVSGKVEYELDRRNYDSPEQASEALREVLSGKTMMTDRMVTALPCRVGLYRRLRFPFREKRKIAAALPLALSAQLPVSLNEQILAFTAPRARDNDYEVDAFAVNKQEISELLTYFPEPEQNPARVDLFPFALLPALGEKSGILIYCRRIEVVVALIVEGKLYDYRLLPGTSEIGEEDLFDFVGQQISQLEYAAGHDELPLWLFGAGVTETLLQLVRETGREMLLPAEEVFGPDLPPEMAPVALLALAELRGKANINALNFRQGEFEARGQLEIMRPKLIVAAILLVLVLIGGAATMHLSYLQKSSAEEEMTNTMRRMFQQVMPAGSVVVDVPLQMESQLRQLQTEVQLFGLDGRGAVAVLEELSTTINEELRIELQDFNYSPTEVRIAGTAESFDAVNQITEDLGARPLFSEVTIANARLAADNVRVDFELRLVMAAGGEQ